MSFRVVRCFSGKKVCRNEPFSSVVVIRFSSAKETLFTRDLDETLGAQGSDREGV